MTNSFFLILLLTTNWQYSGQFLPERGAPREVRRGTIVTNIAAVMMWKGEQKMLVLEQLLGPEIGEHMFLLNAPLPTNGFLTPLSRPMLKAPAPVPPMPPATATRVTTNAVARPAVKSVAPGTTVPGYPLFRVMTNELAKAKAKLGLIILPGPPLSGTNIFKFIDPDYHVPIFSADAVGMKYGSNYVIESTRLMKEKWVNYYGPFTWEYHDPYAYLRWQDVIEQVPCVPVAPNGASYCAATQKQWRIRMLP